MLSKVVLSVAMQQSVGSFFGRGCGGVLDCVQLFCLPKAVAAAVCDCSHCSVKYPGC